MAGGCIHRCYRVTIDGKPRFLKVNAARFAGTFAAEADGLAALRDAGVRVPEACACAAHAGQAYLLLEFIELETSGDWAAMGRMLAQAHRRRGPRFGWTRDNFIGATAQVNGWRDEWQAFFAECRLGPQLRLAEARGYRFAIGNALDLLAQHRPPPSLLHGDLWGGNAAFTAAGAPVLFDPAVYYGDREADLAMTELFGGFPKAFYAAYEAAYALDAGYARRKHLYNLYHLLNHLNLFGGGYLGQVKATLGLLRDAL